MNFPVVEARFLIKYKNLSFDNCDWQILTIHGGICKFYLGRAGGWKFIAIYADKDVEDEPIFLFFDVTMSWQFQQSEGIKAHKSPSGAV